MPSSVPPNLVNNALRRLTRRIAIFILFAVIAAYYSNLEPLKIASLTSAASSRLTTTLSHLRTMSHTARAPSARAAPAPWRAAFLDHVTKHMSSPELTFSTLHQAPPGSPVPYVPHARTCIFRGMWATLPENKHNDAPKNPPVYESDMPTITSDVRMEKVPEIFATSAGHADRPGLTGGSGGGGPVEAVFWVKDTTTQWRIKGTAYVVGQDIEGDGKQEKESSGVRTVKSEVGKGMRETEEGKGKESEWSWQTELTGHFGNLSPGSRGMFKQPPPGQSVSKPYNNEEEQMGAKVTTLDDPVARRNFRVVIIKPEHVESVNLTDLAAARRQRYSFDPDTGEWHHEETWP